MGIKATIKSWWDGKTGIEKVESVFRGLTALITLGGVAYCAHEVKTSQNILSFAVDKIGDGVDVEVSRDLIEAATNVAAKKQIEKAVAEVVRAKENAIQEETRTAVAEKVSDTRRQITDVISDKLADECRKINQEEILKEIRDKAADKLSDKLDHHLDSITDEYSKNLNNMGKIYEALAEKLQSKA